MDTTQYEEDEVSAADLLVGGDTINAFLITLGMPETVDAYYLKKRGWPIGKSSGGQSAPLVASKRRLTRYTQKIAAPQKIDAA